MRNFKSFVDELNEEHDASNEFHIEVDSRSLENNMESINQYFDSLAKHPYRNVMVFYDQVRGTLERYGMIVHPDATKHFMNFDSEMAFKLGDTMYFLYVVYNTKSNGLVDGYAQVVDEEELDHLINSGDAPNLDDDSEEDETEEMGDNENYRKTDDDAGNTGEY